MQIKLETQRVFRVHGPQRLSSQATKTQGGRGSRGAEALCGSHLEATPPPHFLREKEPSWPCDAGIRAVASTKCHGEKTEGLLLRI